MYRKIAQRPKLVLKSNKIISLQQQKSRLGILVWKRVYPSTAEGKGEIFPFAHLGCSVFKHLLLGCWIWRTPALHFNILYVAWRHGRQSPEPLLLRFAGNNFGHWKCLLAKYLFPNNTFKYGEGRMPEAYKLNRHSQTPIKCRSSHPACDGRNIAGQHSLKQNSLSHSLRSPSATSKNRFTFHFWTPPLAHTSQFRQEFVSFSAPSALHADVWSYIPRSSVKQHF